MPFFDRYHPEKGNEKHKLFYLYLPSPLVLNKDSATDLKKQKVKIKIKY